MASQDSGHPSDRKLVANDQTTTEAADLEGVIENPQILVPEGLYPVRYSSYKLRNTFGNLKLETDFYIIEGKHCGTCVKGFFPVVAKNVTPQGQAGFRAVFNSKLARADGLIFQKRRRIDRLSLAAWRGLDLAAHIRDVSRDSEGRHLPAVIRYSVVDRILGVFTNDELESYSGPSFLPSRFKNL